MKSTLSAHLSVLWAASCFALVTPAAAQDVGPPPPPISIPADSRVAEAQRQAEPFTISVRIMGQDRELWAGDLAMSGSNRAQVRLDVQDVDIKCPLENARFASRRNAIELQVRRGYGRDNARYTVEANWTRPTSSCAEQGSRATGFEVQVELEEGTPRVIEADGGLRVELTRRK